MRVVDEATAPGPDVRLPPSDSQAAQLVPFHMRCQIALSVPRAKTSSRPAAPEAMSGSDVRVPPIDCQANAKPTTLVVCGTNSQPLSSVGVAKRVCAPIA